MVSVLDWTMDWTQLWTHKEDAETVAFYSVVKCYQVHVAILIHKMSC